MPVPPIDSDSSFALTPEQRRSMTYSSQALRRWGWVSFWIQLALSLVSAVILLFSVAFTAAVRVLPHACNLMRRPGRPAMAMVLSCPAPLQLPSGCSLSRSFVRDLRTATDSCGQALHGTAAAAVHMRTVSAA
jgi:Protein of unknown function (DUF3611)